MHIISQKNAVYVLIIIYQGFHYVNFAVSQLLQLMKQIRSKFRTFYDSNDLSEKLPWQQTISVQNSLPMLCPNTLCIVG